MDLPDSEGFAATLEIAIRNLIKCRRRHNEKLNE